jgi:hypothetical protein
MSPHAFASEWMPEVLETKEVIPRDWIDLDFSRMSIEQIRAVRKKGYPDPRAISDNTR